ncbi:MULTISPECIES: hypothetical protein [Eikenella]|uniref:hypothetical protein n=1 Tax=Eikenella TaxID=538 RepID=UPI0012E7D164|nr:MULTISPECIES: hypothetical protein [Eikenella]
MYRKKAGGKRAPLVFMQLKLMFYRQPRYANGAGGYLKNGFPSFKPLWGAGLAVCRFTFSGSLSPGRLPESIGFCEVKRAKRISEQPTTCAPAKRKTSGKFAQKQPIVQAKRL